MVGLYQMLRKNGLLIFTLLGFALCAIGILIVTTSLPDDAGAKELVKSHSGAFNFILSAAYGLFFIGVAAAVIFPLVYMAKNFKESVRFLIGLAIIILLFIVARMLGDGNMVVDLQKKFPNLAQDTGTIAFVDGSIMMLYFMVILAVAAALFGSVRGLFK